MSKEINVLFLDDEDNILKSIQRLFINDPSGVITTSDPAEALEIIDREKIKVVFSDQRMPGITGVEFLKKLKDERPDIVRILFTGYTDIKAVEDSVNISRVYRFITKPWSAEELKLTVKQAIEFYDLIVENKKLYEEAKNKNEELEDLNMQLMRSYEAQREFTSTVSHELRTPLASIKSTVDLVLSETAGTLTGDQSKFLNKTKNNVDRLNRLINDILDLTKLESGKLELKLEPNDIGKIIQEAVENQEPTAKEKGLELKVKLPKKLPQVSLDPDKISQVMVNLLNNAIKFTEKGLVSIDCQIDKEHNNIEISVNDTGPGINESDKGKLFKKFQQLGDPIQHAGGTGLGLAICKEIVSHHGGKIWVESLEGSGASFKFMIPIEERRESGK